MQNNGLEASNRYIKDLSHKRLGLIQFMNVVISDIVKDWSDIRNEERADAKKFNEIPILQLPDWTTAFQWSVQDKQNVKYKV